MQMPLTTRFEYYPCRIQSHLHVAVPSKYARNRKSIAVSSFPLLRLHQSPLLRWHPHYYAGVNSELILSTNFILFIYFRFARASWKRHQTDLTGNLSGRILGKREDINVALDFISTAYLRFTHKTGMSAASLITIMLRFSCRSHCLSIQATTQVLQG
jgi:hypothetical protein